MLLMFKYLRMDAYRLIKTKTLYVALGIILAAVAFSVYMMSTAAMPDLSATGGEGPSSMAIQNGKELGSFTQTQSGSVDLDDGPPRLPWWSPSSLRLISQAVS